MGEENVQGEAQVSGQGRELPDIEPGRRYRFREYAEASGGRVNVGDPEDIHGVVARRPQGPGLRLELGTEKKAMLAEMGNEASEVMRQPLGLSIFKEQAKRNLAKTTK